MPGNSSRAATSKRIAELEKQRIQQAEDLRTTASLRRTSKPRRASRMRRRAVSTEQNWVYSRRAPNSMASMPTQLHRNRASASRTGEASEPDAAEWKQGRKLTHSIDTTTAANNKPERQEAQARRAQLSENWRLQQAPNSMASLQEQEPRRNRQAHCRLEEKLLAKAAEANSRRKTHAQQATIVQRTSSRNRPAGNAGAPR